MTPACHSITLTKSYKESIPRRYHDHNNIYCRCKALQNNTNTLKLLTIVLNNKCLTLQRTELSKVIFYFSHPNTLIPLSKLSLFWNFESLSLFLSLLPFLFFSFSSEMTQLDEVRHYSKRARERELRERERESWVKECLESFYASLETL